MAWTKISLVFINHSKKIVSEKRLKLKTDNAASTGNHGKEHVSCTTLGLRLGLDYQYKCSVSYLHVLGSRYYDRKTLSSISTNKNSF